MSRENQNDIKMDKRKVLWLIGVLFFSYSLNAQLICPPDPSTYTANTYVNETYSSSTGWTFVNSGWGTISVVGGAMNFNDVAGGSSHRAYKTYTTGGGTNLISSYCKNFQVDLNFTVTSGDCPAHYIVALTQTTGEIVSSNHDAIGVSLTAPGNGGSPPPNCNGVPDGLNPWRIGLFVREGSTAQTFTGPSDINLPALNVTYYLRLIRKRDDLCLSIFDDAGFTNHIPGSPICWQGAAPFASSDPLEIANLKYVQHGVNPATFGYPIRHISMDVDNFKFSQVLPSTGGFTCSPRLANNGAADFNERNFSELKVYPNPTQDVLFVQVPGENQKIQTIKITDLFGRIIKSISIIDSENSTAKVNVNDLSGGIYFIEVAAEIQQWKTKVSVVR